MENLLEVNNLEVIYKTDKEIVYAVNDVSFFPSDRRDPWAWSVRQAQGRQLFPWRSCSFFLKGLQKSRRRDPV